MQSTRAGLFWKSCAIWSWNFEINTLNIKKLTCCLEHLLSGFHCFSSCMLMVSLWGWVGFLFQLWDGLVEKEQLQTYHLIQLVQFCQENKYTINLHAAIFWPDMEGDAVVVDRQLYFFFFLTGLGNLVAAAATPERKQHPPRGSCQLKLR